jgi:hypothetical protein
MGENRPIPPLPGVGKKKMAAGRFGALERMLWGNGVMLRNGGAESQRRGHKKYLDLP